MEAEDWLWDPMFTPNANPKVIELNSKGEEKEKSVEMITMRHKSKEINFNILDKLETISRRLDRLEDLLNKN
jgi:hypothetical protein